MELDDKQKMLFEFVKKQHGSQIRKYTGEPYYNHVFSVAKIVNEFEPNCIEIALCHDLFEDTKTCFTMLYNELTRCGYNSRLSYNICSHVLELTDVYVKEDYPYFNRAKRKDLEAKRLGNISLLSQSVKYADLIDNTKSIVENDKNFAKVYIKEKKQILELMNCGNVELYDLCRKQIESL